MIRQGIVTKIDGPWVMVSTQPIAGCCGSGGEGACHCSGTGKSVEFKAYNRDNLILKIGDEIEVLSENAKALRDLLTLLVMPLGIGTAGFAASWFFLDKSSALLTLGSVAGFVLGLVLDSLFIKPKPEAYPQVLKVLPITKFVPIV